MAVSPVDTRAHGCSLIATHTRPSFRPTKGVYIWCREGLCSPSKGALRCRCGGARPSRTGNTQSLAVRRLVRVHSRCRLGYLSGALSDAPGQGRPRRIHRRRRRSHCMAPPHAVDDRPADRGFGPDRPPRSSPSSRAALGQFGKTTPPRRRVRQRHCVPGP